ncbi:hypothetical protein ZYGR_0S00880 [Zygosaccharomyces rouxii]|uniref:Citrate synthase n=2 Tax=Zygosaccharomyces rouxii TaxID=4956 RepID=C5DXE7_ZYGRC|nr:uncharacterized protein ZYRO0F04444g [Zygosaccharomyces rouxii]KAH9199221.1 citrate synthase-like protein [Zygosaccharomyces rouxii]GAV49955.1 hypothetical protein ZYGR_0S00880 [Zygosaccharomyces rouxii]CAR28458.1 ZYRO0F04444p [Zygosaccharomyces rouxii]
MCKIGHSKLSRIEKMLLSLTTRRSLYSTKVHGSSSLELKTVLKELIPQRKQEILELKKNYGDVKVGDITIGSVIGGMRGNNSMFWQSTSLDPYEGIRFQGKTIQDCQRLLPKDPKDPDEKRNFLPEGMFWLLVTGQIATQEQASHLSRELGIRGRKLPDDTEKLMSTLPSDIHPMTQLAIGLASMNQTSKFAKKYERGDIGKNEYWEYAFDDVLNLIAALPQLSGKIYSKIAAKGKPLGQFKEDRDWSYNICSLLGMTSEDSCNRQNLTAKQSGDFVNLMRLYTGIHVDHEGGNVSAHTTHLVGSALSDPYLSYSSGIMGLAGPLHGLAAQEVVRFLIEMNSCITSPQNEIEIKKYLWKLLESKRVVPGYGHAVLRKTDPRFVAMLDFVKARPEEFSQDENVILMEKLSKIAPKVLKEHGKCKNPYPNVDSASGILFYHYGIKELLFFTVIFGCSRSMGPLTQLVWDRALGLPIERPKSLDFNSLRSLCR